MATQEQGKPSAGTTTGDVTIKQLGQWMQKQQNKIDDELKEVHSKLAELDKTSALTEHKVGEISTNLTAFKADTKAEFKEIRDSISSLKTTIAWAGGAVAAFSFVIGIGVMILRTFLK